MRTTCHCDGGSGVVVESSPPGERLFPLGGARARGGRYSVVAVISAGWQVASGTAWLPGRRMPGTLYHRALREFYFMRRSASIESTRCLRWSGIRNSGTSALPRRPSWSNRERTASGTAAGRHAVRAPGNPSSSAQDLSASALSGQRSTLTQVRPLRRARRA